MKPRPIAPGAPDNVEHLALQITTLLTTHTHLADVGLAPLAQLHLSAI